MIVFKDEITWKKCLSVSRISTKHTKQHEEKLYKTNKRRNT